MDALKLQSHNIVHKMCTQNCTIVYTVFYKIQYVNINYIQVYIKIRSIN